MAVQISYEEYVRKILLSPVYDVAKVTSLQKMEKLSDRFGNEIFLKREDEQVVHSFKLRGAYNKIAQLPHEQLKKGIVAASAGNHAQGCALSSKVLGIKANIVMSRELTVEAEDLTEAMNKAQIKMTEPEAMKELTPTKVYFEDIRVNGKEIVVR